MNKTAKVTLGILGAVVATVVLGVVAEKTKKKEPKLVKLEFPEGWDMATKK